MPKSRKKAGSKTTKKNKTTRTQRSKTQRSTSTIWGIALLLVLGIGFVYQAFFRLPVSESDLVQVQGTLKDWFISNSQYASDQFFLREFPKAAFSVDKAAFDVLIAEDHLRPGAKFTISVKKLDIEDMKRGLAGIFPQDVSVYALSLGQNTFLSLLESNNKWNAQRKIDLVFGVLLLLLAGTLLGSHRLAAFFAR